MWIRIDLKVVMKVGCIMEYTCQNRLCEEREINTKCGILLDISHGDKVDTEESE